MHIKFRIAIPAIPYFLLELGKLCYQMSLFKIAINAYRKKYEHYLYIVIL